MIEGATHPAIASWESFYVIVGSSGAALTGLQFVVIAVVAGSRARSSNGEIAAFGTPTIVHFCAVLLIAAILSAPWQTLTGVSIALGVCGLAGVIYGLIIVKRARKQTGYKPVFEDWLWHAGLPIVAYLLLLISAFILPGHPTRILFIVASAALLLLAVGIHNAWDAVTYIALVHRQKSMAPDKKE